MKDKTFSERKGLVPEKTIQLESMDDELRNRLWNCFFDYLIGNNRIGTTEYSKFKGYYGKSITNFVLDYCGSFKKIATDYIKMRYSVSRDLTIITGYVEDNIKEDFRKFEWNKVFDFFEFVVNYLQEVDEGDILGDKMLIENILIKNVNNVLEEEKSGYRLLGSKIVSIIDEVELSEIKEATAFDDKLKVVSDHIKKALELYSDRENPDYVNSVKESIHAVDAMATIISGKKHKGLGGALNSIVDTGKVEIHENLKRAYKDIYDWTNDAGIRHTMVEGELNVNPEDAKYMVVSCSAFVNYLKEKAIKGGKTF